MDASEFVFRHAGGCLIESLTNVVYKEHIF